MAWKECDRVSERRELIVLASRGGVSIAGLAGRFGVSRKTVYKWIERHRQAGDGGLVDRSRRPYRCPHRTPAQVERAVRALRGEHPAWGGRKLHHRLKAMGVAGVPSPSTITRILRAHGLIDPADSATRKPWQRFERAAPNDLWQMDFKSPVPRVVGGACHPLTVLDDHSRYALGLHACENQQRRQVHDQLTRLFERYGLPWAMLSDNGTPWRSTRMDGSLTRLEVWLMRLDIRVLHGRPYHPQTQGKDERFHRTMQVEVLQGRSFRDRASVQSALDPWRGVYNHERPHEALGMATPGERYRPSRRSMPRVLPPVEYGLCDQTRRVDAGGLFRFQGRRLRAGGALAGESVGLRATATDGVWSVYYGRMRIGAVDLRRVGPKEFAHVLGPRPGRRTADIGAQDVESV